MEDNMIHCNCGVEISPLFIFNVSETKGYCPVCNNFLITEDPLFFKKAIRILSEHIEHPNEFSDKEIEKNQLIICKYLDAVLQGIKKTISAM